MAARSGPGRRLVFHPHASGEREEVPFFRRMWRRGLAIVQGVFRYQRGIRSLRALRAGTARPASVSKYRVAVMFPDAPVNLYQLRQWYRPLERLARDLPVVIAVRQPDVAAVVLAETTLPVAWVTNATSVEQFFAEHQISVVLYTNQNVLNFRYMRLAKPAHVFISHGESDKAYMTSNQLKAYDYICIAGQAARERIDHALIGLDPSRLLEVGRPQADMTASESPLPDDERVVVLYAPTWEGDRPSMSYGSVATHGEALVRSIVGNPRLRLVYRAHPRSGIFSREYGHAHRRLVRIIEAANREDRTARHLVDTSTSFDWQLGAADVCVCDISAVATDWLATQKRLFITEPVSALAHVDPAGIAGSAELVTVVGAADIASRVLSDPDPAAFARYRQLSRRYFGDFAPGESIEAFVAAMRRLADERAAVWAARHIDREPSAAE